MLLGEHEHSLDDKNRLTLPAKLREQLGDQVVITRGMDGCLYVYARAAFDALAARIGSLDPLSRRHAPRCSATSSPTPPPPSSTSRGGS